MVNITSSIQASGVSLLTCILTERSVDAGTGIGVGIVTDAILLLISVSENCPALKMETTFLYSSGWPVGALTIAVIVNVSVPLHPQPLPTVHIPVVEL